MPRVPFAAVLFVLATTLAAQGLEFAAANQKAKQPRWLSLRWAEFATDAAPPVLPADLVAPPPPADAAVYWLVQLPGPVTPVAIRALAATGLELLDYVPNFAFVARGTPAQLAAARALPWLVWSSPLHPAYRIAPELVAAVAPAPRTLLVHAFAGVTQATIRAQVAAAGLQVLEQDDLRGTWLLVATGTREQAMALARQRDVAWIEAQGTCTERNGTMVWTVQTGVANDTRIWSQGLHGEGEIVGHIDSGIALNACWFQDPVQPIGPLHRKLVYNSGTTASSHGTHTAGTVAGDSFPINASTANRGLAWASRLAHTTSLTSFLAPATAHRNAGARTHTNSWGNDGTKNYDTLARDVDVFSFQDEENLVCFAVSNGSVVTNPENAKNCLAVGASQNGVNAINHCSGGTGPTLDGRRKPEIYTPGCSLVSASTSACATGSSTGTSMACPSTTAAAALVRQYFREGFYPSGARTAADAFVPSGALLKAMLIQGGQDMSGIAGYPSLREGWGRLVLDQALAFAGDKERLFVVDVRNQEGLTTGNRYSYKLAVTSSGTPLRVTMAFHDAPGTLLASNPVVNDLDLELTAPDQQTVYVGNVINTATGWSQTGGTVDAKNNVERVLIQAPTPGEWTVTVRAWNVPQGTQGFALAATGELSAGTTFAANLAYGLGKAGTGGVPQLRGAPLPRIPTYGYTLSLTQALPYGNAFLLLGLAKAAAPFDGATILVQADGAIPLTTSASGGFALPAPIPEDHALHGVSVYFQTWIANDPLAAGAGWAASNGLQVRIGN